MCRAGLQHRKESIMETIIITLATQCPVIGILVWFLMQDKKENARQSERQAEEHIRQQERQAELFQAALDKIVTKIGERLDRIECDLRTHIIKKEGKNTLPQLGPIVNAHNGP